MNTNPDKICGPHQREIPEKQRPADEIEKPKPESMIITCWKCGKVQQFDEPIAAEQCGCPDCGCHGKMTIRNAHGIYRSGILVGYEPYRKEDRNG